MNIKNIAIIIFIISLCLSIIVAAMILIRL